MSTSCASETNEVHPAQGEVAAQKDDHRFVPDYEKAEKRTDWSAEKLMRDAGFLEDLSAYATSLVKLPQDIPVGGISCGEPNLYWTSKEKAIIACYEEVTEMRELFRASDKADHRPSSSSSVDGRVIGAMSGMFFHELGHGLIHLYDLPAVGKEEDDADQLAAVVLINDGKQGQEYLMDMAEAFRLLGIVEKLGGGDKNQESEYADVHSLNEQRYYNLLCYQYGAHPEQYKSLVGKGGLPKERAEDCPDEWKQAESAWTRLLKPHLR
ncbi:DUF4344 domain-containing metallopeptidase [Streptomyces vastus]